MPLSKFIYVNSMARHLKVLQLLGRHLGRLLRAYLVAPEPGQEQIEDVGV